MAATITIYPAFQDVARFVGDSGVNVILLDSGYTYSAAHDTLSDITGDQLSTANGYTSGGIALSSLTWTRASGVLPFDAANPVWTASGGSIVARYAALHINATLDSIVNPLMALILLDNSPADVTTTDGNTLTLNWHADGILVSTIA